jgi:hypothetical protein
MCLIRSIRNQLRGIQIVQLVVGQFLKSKYRAARGGEWSGLV